MIDILLLSMNAVSCMTIMFVAGCYCLSLDRPVSFEDYTLLFGTMGLSIYGLANAMAPTQWNLVPSVFAVGFRCSGAVTAIVIYHRVFASHGMGGWRLLWRRIAATPHRLRAWVREHVDAGRQQAIDKANTRRLP